MDSQIILVLSYGIAVIQWIMSCHKNRMKIHVITLWRVYVTSLTTSMSAKRFLTEIMLIFKEIKSHFKGSDDKQNLTLVVISYDAKDSFHIFHMK